jgi:hypothetical protein
MYHTFSSSEQNILVYTLLYYMIPTLILVLVLVLILILAQYYITLYYTCSWEVVSPHPHPISRRCSDHPHLILNDRMYPSPAYPRGVGMPMPAIVLRS